MDYFFFVYFFFYIYLLTFFFSSFAFPSNFLIVLISHCLLHSFLPPSNSDGMNCYYCLRFLFPSLFISLFLGHRSSKYFSTVLISHLVSINVLLLNSDGMNHFFCFRLFFFLSLHFILSHLASLKLIFHFFFFHFTFSSFVSLSSSHKASIHVLPKPSELKGGSVVFILFFPLFISYIFTS